ncbi:hypothetical protein FSP39_011054 [Pinctada imbricata]|uniref:Major facilitator superfamily (MFS) profile domain-containing protein n=1 Tax=Pinctada imbricata TaxID=66713 RepID=A0AA89C3C1_PINIB|nr:hypothetical protein FSP39_011054 [Pinctada imbricata]
MSSVSEYLENTLMECGGFGRFQIIHICIVLVSKISITWSLIMMAFAGATPDWWCQSANLDSNATGSGFWNMTSGLYSKSCSVKLNGSSQACPSKNFDSNMNTIVSEWELVCDKKWVTATISTIQMAGLLVSGFLSGQFADVIGRKPTFFGALFIMSFANILAGFSSSWIMFAVMRFFIGLGCGMYVTVYCNYQIEFTPTKYRPLQIAIPDWCIWAAMFGFFSWILHDWAHLHFLTGGITGSFLLSWFFPESFRWLVSNGKIEEASIIIKRIAKMNGRPVPNLDSLKSVVEHDVSLIQGKKYIFLDVFRHWEQVRRTILLGVGWLSCGYGYYAIYYGVDQLTGNIYLNLFLLSVVDIPATIALWGLQNWIGRRWTCFGFFIIGFISTMCVAIAQLISIDDNLRGQLINGFALAGKMGVSAAWGAILTYTVELYPTVIRNMGFGLQNSIARIGAMIAPQIILISMDTAGVMYFVCSAMMLLSAICSLMLPETKGKTIPDTLETEEKSSSQKEIDMNEVTKLNSDVNC